MHGMDGDCAGGCSCDVKAYFTHFAYQPLRLGFLELPIALTDALMILMVQFGSCCINAALKFTAPMKGKGEFGRGLVTLEGRAFRVNRTLTSELVIVETKMLQIDTVS